MTRFAKHRAVLLALVACAALAACTASDGSPTSARLTPTGPFADRSGSSSNDPKSASQRTEGTANTSGFSAAKCENRPLATNSGTFGPRGGVLVFGTSLLIIPGGALHDTVTITATISDASSSSVEFSPHGLEFARPAGLLLGTAECTLSNPDFPVVAYLGANGEVLELIRAVFDAHWHTVATPIDHFSGYAIAF